MKKDNKMIRSNYLKLIYVMFVIFLSSCKKDLQESWKIEVEPKTQKVEIEDISSSFYNSEITFEEFKKRYPFFLSPGYEDSFYEKKRKDSLEIAIYKKSVSPQILQKLQIELPKLFSRIQHYFPKFVSPKVFVYSSATAMYMEPVIYNPEKKTIIIDLSSFLGTNSEYYKGIEDYMKINMNVENLLPKISENIAFSLVKYGSGEQKFIDEIIYSGKVMILQDAFLPETPDHLKMPATAKQYEWSKANEGNIWNYFIENETLFSPDPRMVDRFISPGPFSKFYTEIDKKSSPQVGVFIGWQIVRKFLTEKSEIQLNELVNMNATDIFNQSNYKPQN